MKWQNYLSFVQLFIEMYTKRTIVESWECLRCLTETSLSESCNYIETCLIDGPLLQVICWTVRRCLSFRTLTRQKARVRYWGWRLPPCGSRCGPWSPPASVECWTATWRYGSSGWPPVSSETPHTWMARSVQHNNNRLYIWSSVDWKLDRFRIEIFYWRLKVLFNT